MKKKLLTVTLTILMALSLVACGDDKKGSDEVNVTKASEEETSVEETVLMKIIQHTSTVNYW